MSKFNISYNIVAIDNFSKVARRIAEESKSLLKSTALGNVIQNRLLDTKKKIIESDKIRAEQSRKYIMSVSNDQVRQMNDYHKKKSKSIDDISKKLSHQNIVQKKNSRVPAFNFKAPLTSFSNFLGKINILSYRSFRQMMYTALPLIAIFKRPFEDLVSLQKNSIILTNEIGTSGANAVNKINTAISKTTLMSKASLTDASRILAQNGASAKQITSLMPVVADMAASSGGNTTASQTASQLNTMLRSKASQAVDGMIIQGSTVADRLQSLLTQRSLIQDTAEKQANTPTGKLVKSFMLLSDGLRKLLKSAAPAFNMLSNIINSVANVVSNLAEKHKELSNVIIGFVGVVLTVIAVLLTFKAVEMGVLMLTRGLTYGILVADKAFTVIIATIRIARTAMLLLNAAFLANPIGVLIGAMILLGTVLYVAYQKFAIVRKVVSDIGSAFMFVAKGGLHIFATAISWLIKKVTEGFALILHAVGYFSSDAEKWANSLDKVTNSWDKVGNAQKKVIANHKNMNSTASMGSMIDYQKTINQTIGVKDNSQQSNVNNVNVHLYQNGNKTKTYNSNQRKTSVYDIDNSDVYALGDSMMGGS